MGDDDAFATMGIKLCREPFGALIVLRHGVGRLAEPILAFDRAVIVQRGADEYNVLDRDAVAIQDVNIWELRRSCTAGRAFGIEIEALVLVVARDADDGLFSEATLVDPVHAARKTMADVTGDDDDVVFWPRLRDHPRRAGIDVDVLLLQIVAKSWLRG